MPIKTLIAVVALLITVLLIWRPWHETPVPVWVAKVETGPVETNVANTRTGTIKACRRSKLSMPIGGTVDKLLVDEGDQVQADQLLLELWNLDRKAQVEQARQHELALAQAEQSICLTASFKKREAERQEQLLQRKLTAVEQVDIARTQADSAERDCVGASHQLQMAQADLAYAQSLLQLTQLKAPFAGVVAEINGEVGEYITPSPPGIPTPAAVDLIDYSCLYVTAPIDEIDAASVRVGQPARVTLDAFPDQTFAGHVTRIAPYVLDLEKQARTVAIDVQLIEPPPEVNFLVGYSADVTVILAAKAQVLRLPSQAVLSDDSVWRVNTDNRLEKQTVVRGIGDWSFTEIREGLAAGDRVVASPDLPDLDNGLLIEPRHD